MILIMPASYGIAVLICSPLSVHSDIGLKLCVLIYHVIYQSHHSFSVTATATKVILYILFVLIRTYFFLFGGKGHFFFLMAPHYFFLHISSS